MTTFKSLLLFLLTSQIVRPKSPYHYWVRDFPVPPTEFILNM